MTGKQLAKEIELDASVEEVWKAVSTGEGMATWFVPHRVTPPTDLSDVPAASADFGSGNVTQGRVLAWDPPNMVRYGGDAGNPTEILEFLVESTEDNGTVLRLVQSEVLGEDWEMDYHSQGWDLFLHNLDSYLRYFAPAPATNALAMAFSTVDGVTVWDRYHHALGTTGDLTVGSPVDLTPEGVEPIRGQVDVHRPGQLLGIRTDDGLYRFGGAGADTWGVTNSFHYRYGVELDGPEWTQRWQDWLAALFPASEAPPLPAM